MFPEGKSVIGRLINTAASTVQDIAFTDVNGNTHTFATGERLIIDTITVNNRATAKDLTVFQDADADGAIDAGEELAVATFAAAGNANFVYEKGLASKPITAAATNTFKALASAAGAIDVVVTGEVVKS